MVVAAVRLKRLVEFTRNNAGQFGGGAAFVGTESRAFILQATFEENTAGSGGAVSARDSKAIELGGDSNHVAVAFVSNHALNGGAVHLHLDSAISGAYKVRSTLKSVLNQCVFFVQIQNCLFEQNEAVESDDIASPGRDERFFAGRKRLEEMQNGGGFRLSPECSNCSTGRGGALFIGLRGMHIGMSVTVLLSDLRIESNQASVGGRKDHLGRMTG